MAAVQAVHIDLGFTMARLNYHDLLAAENFISFRGPFNEQLEDFGSIACHQAGFIRRMSFHGAQSYTIQHMAGGSASESACCQPATKRWARTAWSSPNLNHPCR